MPDPSRQGCRFLDADPSRGSLEDVALFGHERSARGLGSLLEAINGRIIQTPHQYLSHDDHPQRTSIIGGLIIISQTRDHNIAVLISARRQSRRHHGCAGPDPLVFRVFLAQVRMRLVQAS